MVQQPRKSPCDMTEDRMRAEHFAIDQEAHDDYSL